VSWWIPIDCTRSPSSTEEETEFFHDMEFFKYVILINEDPFGKKRISEKFARFLDSKELGGVHLREAN
jgi:hypothetical protein